MHAELTSSAASSYPIDKFTSAYRDSALLSTATEFSPGELEGPTSEDGADVVKAPIAVTTRAFGQVSDEIRLPVADGAVAWAPNLVFPGLAENEHLDRETKAPPRAPILAKDGTPLAEGVPTAGVARSSSLTAADNVTGAMTEPKDVAARHLEALGFPKRTLVGASGLERAYNDRLLGTPGGKLLARGDDGQTRVIATSKPKQAPPLKTTIDPALQASAVAALGAPSYGGGVAVLDAKTGEVLALAGSAYSVSQPPGSTFKILTTTAALEENDVKLSDTFPVATYANVGGRAISNAGGESCGGTFVEAFAESCNSVFAPLGAKVGGPKLVDVAERYGFNAPPELFDAKATALVRPKESVLPTDIHDDLNAGVTAIGQGEVLATVLGMASVAQTIAAGGVRSPTPIVTEPELRPDAEPVRVTDEKIASTIRDLMVAVVNEGTGTAAALPNVQVAGKTGTAEVGPNAEQSDAWFTCFAPAKHPEIVVAAMVVYAGGSGGEIAAPIAHSVLTTKFG